MQHTKGPSVLIDTCREVLAKLWERLGVSGEDNWNCLGYESLPTTVHKRMVRTKDEVNVNISILKNVTNEDNYTGFGHVRTLQNVDYIFK